MTATKTPGAAEAKSPVAPGDDKIADFFDRLRENPRPTVTRILLICVAVAAAVLGFQTWRSHRASKETRLQIDFQSAIGTRTPSERVTVLAGLKDRTADGPMEAERLYHLARAYKDSADASDRHAVKVEHYRLAVETVDELERRFPQSVWTKLPTRPNPAAGATPVTFAGALRQYAAEQLNWLQQHEFTATPAADKDLSVTFELDNGKSFTVGRFYSRVSPFHVQNFIDLCRNGYFEGTGFGTLKKWYPKTDAAPGEQAVVGIEGGDAMTRVTPDLRSDDALDGAKYDLPWSLPEEPNGIPIDAGSLVAKPDLTAGGDSPTRFTLYFQPIAYPTGVPFAQVTEGLDALKEIAGGETEADRPERLKKLVRVTAVRVQGSVEFPPTGRALPKFTPEMLPKPEEPVAPAATTETSSKPADQAPESR